MEPVVHELKILPEYFDKVMTFVKPWEYRKNDRDFRTGDMVELNEWIADEGYTGRTIVAKIGYLYHCGNGYVIFTIKDLFQRDTRDKQEG